MQRNYVYFLTEPMGKNFHADFRPELTPKQMLAVGVFGGKYMTDCTGEFPKGWFAHAKLNHERHEPGLNCFGVNASQPLAEWRKKGWIHPDDPRGWFQMVLQVLHGQAVSRRRAPDQKMEGHEKAYCPDQGGVRARGSELPQETKAGAAALGV
jgi:hypothetical protein